MFDELVLLVQKFTQLCPMICSTDIYYPTCETEKLLIKSIWRLKEHNSHTLTETILPKGMVEIIFNLSDPVRFRNANDITSITLPTCFINGVNFKPIHLLKQGQQIFLGIQLNVIALKTLFQIPAREFSNKVIDGSLICKPLSDLYEMLCSENIFEKQVKIIRDWLCQKIKESKHLTLIQKFYHWFFCQQLNTYSVKEFQQKTCISDRQLRRLCTEWLGMNTETYLLYNKYLTSLYLLHDSEESLTQIGLEAGFYDQSHFIREFKGFTEFTPKEYLHAVHGIPGHIFH